MIPLDTFGKYTLCFADLAEDQTLHDHFSRECGWTSEQIAEIMDYAWFCAEVSIWKGGEQLAVEYLGDCCYTKVEDFYTTYKDEYLKDMAVACAATIGDESLIDAIRHYFD